MNVPMSLDDNGSAINVGPVCTAKKLGIKDEELTPFIQGIRAYDNACRQAVGTVMLNITTGAIERRTRFQVVDIKASFNLFLGRLWLYELKVIPSSLYQKVKAIVGGIPISIDAFPMRIQFLDTPIVHVEHDEEDEDLWGFSLEDFLMIEEEEKYHLDFDPYSNVHDNAIMKKQGHFPWMTLGMPGIDRDIAQQTISLIPGMKPVKQKLRCMKPNVAFKIKYEIKKQLATRFIKVSKYPEWIANVVLVHKKDGRVRICVYYRDLNKASPKDGLCLLQIDILVNNFVT
ncbi:uncharacterized protein LOC110729797 [Chenopodium quinoa]|uniref:uncharacterized protein LOC110729797 n=1 Tax=Chenopodium quinoa TaxID=63459 RepID=UPI000B76F0B1|nr:uncharacterized protein LOC110729797 [Chenopodium quinoa]